MSNPDDKNLRAQPGQNEDRAILKTLTEGLPSRAMTEGERAIFDGAKNSTFVEKEKTTPMWRCRPKEGGAWLVDSNLEHLGAFLAAETTASLDPENPRSFVLELVEMTDAELAGQGEFDGW